MPATAHDIDFSYPRGSFASRAAIARLGVQLETLSLGAYLGAVAPADAALPRPAAARAASEAQHLSVFAGEVGGHRARPAAARGASDRPGLRRAGRVHELMPKQFYSASEAAKTLGISLDTLRRWDRAGRIETERDGGNRRIVPATEIDRLRGERRRTRT